MATTCVGAVQRLFDGMANFGRVAGLTSLYDFDPSFSETGDRAADVTALLLEADGRFEGATNAAKDVDAACPVDLAQVAFDAGTDVMDLAGREAQGKAIVAAETRLGIQLPRLHPRAALTPAHEATRAKAVRIRAFDAEDPASLVALRGVLDAR